MSNQVKDLTVVQIDELHSSISDFINKKNDGKTIGDYEDMKKTVLTMIRSGYMFNMDRDRLRDAMEDITYMLCPDDCANQDRVERGLEYYDDDDDDDGSSDGCHTPVSRSDKGQKKSAQKDVDLSTNSVDPREDEVEDIGSTSDLN